MMRALPLLLAASLAACAHAPATRGFTFDSGRPGAATTEVLPGMAYSAARGFGYEAAPEGPGKPFFFSSDLEEGNYNVTITFGDAHAASTTTVKAELRRLMLENVTTLPGQFVTRTFTVNVRTPQIKAAGGIAAGVVKLKEPRESVGEARSWDKRLTLEFTGVNPSVRAIAIVPVKAPTLFLLGDSTVCDQGGEPYASWGQMLPRFLKPGIGVANLGQSGETYRESIGRRRLDKILSVMQAGDTVLMQYGHNDQKQIKDGKGGPFTTYKAEIRTHVAGVRAHGGVPVIISPMERRKFDEQGKIFPSLIDYADAARQVAQELGVAFIDLNAMSKPFYEALGPEKSKYAFAEPTPGHTDNTHHNNYGSYQLARAVVSGLRANQLAVATFATDDVPPFDPSRPDPVETFAVPASPGFTTVRPLGDETNK
jgi:lysophospholipase L1-like esterase